MNKKSQLDESLEMMFGMVIIIMVVITVGVFLMNYNSTMQSQDLPTVAKDTVNTYTSNTLSAIDYMAILVYIGLLAISAFVAYKANFALVKVFWWIFAVIFGASIFSIPSNLWVRAKLDIVAVGLLADAMPILNFYFTYFYVFGFIWLAVTGLVLFSRERGVEQ